MTSRQSYGLINPNRIACLYKVGMQRKYKYKLMKVYSVIHVIHSNKRISAS